MRAVSRTEAREHECPECGAKPGERCTGARGKIRESVHRERMHAVADASGHRAAATLSLDGTKLIDASGKVYGQIVGLEIDLHDDPWGTYGGERGEVVESKDEASALSGSAEGQLFDAPDPVAEVFDLYKQVVPGKSGARLTPDARRVVRKALEERPRETVEQAIRGLAASEHHVENGYTGIKYAIGKVKQSESVGDRIDMMASKAPVKATGTGPQQLRDVIPSNLSQGVTDMIYRHVENVRRAVGSDNPGLQQAGRQSAEWLMGRPACIKPVVADGKVIGWKRMDA